MVCILYNSKHIMLIFNGKTYLYYYFFKHNRREELFRISGLRGQYPQLFLVDSQRRLTYIGNHLSLEKMMKENVGQTLFSPSLITDGNKNGKDVDTSFFSV